MPHIPQNNYPTYDVYSYRIHGYMMMLVNEGLLEKTTSTKTKELYYSLQNFNLVVHDPEYDNPEFREVKKGDIVKVYYYTLLEGKPKSLRRASRRFFSWLDIQTDKHMYIFDETTQKWYPIEDAFEPIEKVKDHGRDKI